jgi:hypothetical protein
MTVTFAVTVSVNDEIGDLNERGLVVADASAYLAYADRTDTFGYLGTLEGVTCHRKHNHAYEAATLTFKAPVPSDDDLKRFMDEMAELSRVMSVERVQ